MTFIIISDLFHDSSTYLEKPLNFNATFVELKEF